MKKIIALLGKAGSGKNTAGDMIAELVEDTYQIALADPLKRFCKEVFAFTDEQLWGPSEMRNAPDKRYIRRQWVDGMGIENIEHLTPRFALQLLGTEWGRTCYKDVWVDYAMREAQAYFQGTLNKENGDWIIDPAQIVVITDCRFINEAKRIQELGGEVWRIMRPDARKLGAEGIQAHPSELEQDDPEIEKYVTHTIINDGSLDDLRKKVEVLLKR